MEWSNKAERAEFLTALYVLAETYDKAISEDKAKAYFAALSDLTIEEVSAALLRATREATAKGWFPRPGDLRKMVCGTVEARAELEAAKVLRALGEYSSYSNVAFDDPVTSAVVYHGFGGWGLLGMTTTDDAQKWVRRDFVRLYLEFTENGIRHEGVHQGIGGGKRPLALVGDKSKALALAGIAERPKAIGGGHAQ